MNAMRWSGPGGDGPHDGNRCGNSFLSHSSTRHAAWWVTLGVALGCSGCADPCFDDGLDQGGCPSAGTETDSSSETDSSDDFTASLTNGMTESESGSATETDPTAASATGGSYECPELEEVLLPNTPTIQLVVDQSGSMEQDFGGQSRWNAIVQTLIAPGDGIVTDLQSEIRFGLTLYTNEGNQCPTLQELAPQLDAADEVTTVLEANAPAGDTPTGESLQAALMTLQADRWEGDKILLLATDGEPDTCAVPNPMTDEEISMARGMAVTAVEDAYAADVRTFVVSVGTEIAEEHLQDLANAGAGNMEGDPPATFYTALDQASLAQAFQDIIAGVRDCNLDLPKPLMEEVAPSCTVTVNDTEIPYEDPNGWVLDGENAIELQGDACNAIQEGVVAIGMTCTCEVSQ